MSADRFRWRPFRRRVLQSGLILTTATALGIYFGEYDNVNNYPDVKPFEPPPVTLYLNPDVDWETAMAEATVPYFRYAKSEEEKASEMAMLFNIQELTPVQVQTLFNTVPAQDEQWYAGLFAATDPNDGGPSRVGFQVGDHIFALTEEAIHGIGHISNAVKRSSHPGDVEEMIVFWKVSNGITYQEGAYIWQHGTGSYKKANQFIYLEDKDGNLHILVVKAVQKGTIYESSKACNTASLEGSIDLEIAGHHLVNIHGSLLPNRCAVEKDVYAREGKHTFVHEPKIDSRNNFGDGQNPFDNNPDIGFGKRENVHDNCYCGDYFDDYTDQMEIDEKKEDMPCASSFRTSIPMEEMR